MNKRIDQALNRKVSRQEFLTLSGFFVATVAGAGGIVKLLTGHDLSSVSNADTNANRALPRGFGSGPYGGTKA